MTQHTAHAKNALNVYKFWRISGTFSDILQGDQKQNRPLIFQITQKNIRFILKWP